MTYVCPVVIISVVCVYVYMTLIDESCCHCNIMKLLLSESSISGIGLNSSLNVQNERPHRPNMLLSEAKTASNPVCLVISVSGEMSKASTCFSSSIVNCCLTTERSK